MSTEYLAPAQKVSKFTVGAADNAFQGGSEPTEIYVVGLASGTTAPLVVLMADGTELSLTVFIGYRRSMYGIRTIRGTADDSPSTAGVIYETAWLR
jgi:hypothetical protein